MRALIYRFIDERAGATAIEYGLIAAILSLVAITGFSTMANSVQNAYVGQSKAVDSTRERLR